MQRRGHRCQSAGGFRRLTTAHLAPDQTVLCRDQITHDLGIAAGMCDRVNVMYAGRIVETGTVDELFEQPRMPYAWGLLDSLPRIDDVRGDRLRTIEGLPPLLISPPDACRFNPRCVYARDICRTSEPELTLRGDTAHMARCWATEPEGWIA